MEHLRMEWKRTADRELPPIRLPEGYRIRHFDGSPEEETGWLDIVMKELVEGQQDRESTRSYLYNLENYKIQDTMFVTWEEEICATITVICDDEAKHGFWHTVACNPEHRGKGLGHAMNAAALAYMEERGMETAHLITDDFRIPAIRGYLKVGFFPAPEQLEREDMAQRWADVMKMITENRRV